MSTDDDRITLKVDSLNVLDAEAYHAVLGSTLAALAEINKAVSEYGAVNLKWCIVDAGMNSPLSNTLMPISTSSNNGHYGREVVSDFISGLQHLEGHGTCPKRFNQTVLKELTKMVANQARGLTRIEFFTPSDRRAVVGKKVATNAQTAIRTLQAAEAKLAGKYTEYGSLEGTLRDLLGSSNQLILIDDLTGHRTGCTFSDPKIDATARKGWKGRVVVTGEITYDRKTGLPEKLAADDIRILKDRSKLPQLEDILGINITGGVDSTSYIRAIRDGE